MANQLKYQGTADEAYQEFRKYQERVREYIEKTSAIYFMQNTTVLGSLYATEAFFHRQALIALKAEIDTVK